MKNQLIVKILNNIADILELQDVQWKPQAYRKAAQSIESLSEDIEDIYKQGKLYDIPGIGEHIGRKIEEIIKTGKLNYYDKLKKQVKINLEELGHIPSLGPKKIKLLYDQLKIKNIKDLQKALSSGILEKLPGFRAGTIKNLQEGIEFRKAHPQRFLYIELVPVVEKITAALKKLSHVTKVEVAGSFRRGRETIGDLDFLVVSNKPAEVMQAFTSLPDHKKTISQGTTRSSILLENNLQVDLRVVKEKEFGSALLYFIGSKEHNVELRKIALNKGYSLSEYGLFKLENKKISNVEKNWVAGRTEDSIYKKLNLQFIPAEMRENMGELQAAVNKKIPRLVELKDVKGIFHNHSQWSDGSDSLLEMAQAAQKLKFKFISFNDHFGTVGITNPLTERRLSNYLKEIEQVQKKVDLEIFSGLEVDILKDGSLPLPRQKLRDFDVVIAAVHLATKMPEELLTKRIIAAVENYPINILGHPMDRLLNERPELKFNYEKVFQKAKETSTFLEINSSPKRMDLNGEKIKVALEIGCKFSLGADAHDSSQLQSYPLGILNARRGWCEKKDILNCWDLPKIRKELQK